MYLVISLILLIINQRNFESLHYDILYHLYILLYTVYSSIFGKQKKNGTMTYLNKKKKEKIRFIFINRAIVLRIFPSSEKRVFYIWI